MPRLKPKRVDPQRRFYFDIDREDGVFHVGGGTGMDWGAFTTINPNSYTARCFVGAITWAMEALNRQVGPTRRHLEEGNPNAETQTEAGRPAEAD